MNWRFFAGLGGLALIATLYVGLPMAQGADETGSFSAYQEQAAESSDGWDGLASARAALEDSGYAVRNVASSPLILKDTNPAGTFYIIAGMSLPYSPAEKDALNDFMRRGGTILLLDDVGYGSSVAADYEIGYRTRTVLDSSFERNQSFVKVASQLDTSKVFNVLLNGPVALTDVDKNDTTLNPFLVTSNASYIDLNRNGVVDVVDKVGPFNVGIDRPVGNASGRLIVISDSGWLTNDMLERLDNQEFLLALVSGHLGSTGDGLVLFDESRRNAVGLETGIIQTERSLLILLRSLPSVGMLFSAGLLALAVVFLVNLPGRESWYHRFLPGTYVPPTVDEDRRRMLVDVLRAKDALDEQTGSAHDPVIQQALKDPQSVPESEIPKILRRIVNVLELDVEFPEEDDKKDAVRAKRPPEAAAAGASESTQPAPS